MASLVIAGASATEGGPMGFLPPLLRWPLALAGLAAVWLPQKRRGLAVEGAALALVLGTFALLKLPALRATETDDNIYFYLATRLGPGALPYRDFFFAHPPIHLLVPALVFRLAGFSVAAAKAIPALAQALAGVGLWLAVRPASRGMALLAVLLHLTAYDVLMGSTTLNGQNLITAFLAGALLLATRERFVAAGVCAGLALGSGLYALAGVLALLVACGGHSRRALAGYGAGLLGCVAAWAGVSAWIGGAAFYDDVFRYHLQKPSIDHVPLFGTANPIALTRAYVSDLGAFLSGRTLGESVRFQASLYLAAGLGGLMALREAWGGTARDVSRSLLSNTPRGHALLGGLATMLSLLQWAALNEVYDFYLVPMIGVLVLPAAFMLVTWVSTVSMADSRSVLAGLGGLAAVFCLGPWFVRGLRGPPSPAPGNGLVRYVWHDPEVLVGPAALTRALFFEDHRLEGQMRAPYLHYLWNKSLGFSIAPQIAAYVRDHSEPNETITGASGAAPLVALLAGRRIAADEADTNGKRFQAGLLSEQAFWERVCADRLRFVLAAPDSHFTQSFMENSATARRFFTLDQVFEDPALRHGRSERFVLYRRREGVESLPDGRVCQYLSQ